MRDGKTHERTFRQPPFGAPQVYVFAVIDGNDPGAVYRITKGLTVLGRGEEADFFIDDDVASKRHCIVRVDGPICTLQDLGSLNGTLVNGRRLREGVAERIRHLDEIRIGDTSLFFLAGRFKH